MAQAITITLSEEEARTVLDAVRKSSNGKDDKNRMVLERVAIMLDAHLKVSRKY